jgi:hypothetical protein
MEHLTRSIRRWTSVVFVTSVFALLCAPGLAQLFGLDASPSLGENRTLAAPPQFPSSLSDALKYPAKLDPFLQDHIGFRSSIITLNNWIRYHLFGEFISSQVVVGQHGRIFFTSHEAAHPYSLIRTVCGIGVSDADAAAAAGAVSKLIDRFRRVAPSVLFIVAPSPTSLYPEDLPPWLAHQCAHAVPTLTRVAEGIAAEDSGRFLFPISVAKEARDPVIPSTRLHWDGAGVRSIIDYIATKNLNLAPQFDVPMVAKTEKSDLSQFMPGLVFEDQVKVPDWSASPVDACSGGSCFPEIEKVADVLGDVSRYHSRVGGQGRLLLISDSFGALSAGYFSAYFDEVAQFNLNNLVFGKMSLEQIHTFRNFAFDTYMPKFIIILIHDGAILYYPQRLQRMLWPELPAKAP